MKKLNIVAALLAARAAASLGSRHDISPKTAHQLSTRDSYPNGLTPTNPKTWWRAEIAHNGTTPFSSDSSYQYYRKLSQYGADPSGNKDSSDAFNKAISDGNRANNTVTTRPAYIYVEPGTYRIKQPINMLVSTFLVGDPLSIPTLVADPALGYYPVINGFDMYQGDISSTKNFYMTVRNLKIDSTGVDPGANAVGMDWSVSQGCSLSNVHIVMPEGSKHVGITMNQGGSGTIITDSTFTGGAVGIRLQNQQYMLKGLSFDRCNTGVYVNNVYIATFQGLSFSKCNFGIDMGRSGSAGAVSVVDASVTSCGAGVNAFVSGTGQGSLVIDQLDVKDSTAVKASDGRTLLAGSVPRGQTWVLGDEIPDQYQAGKIYDIKRPDALMVNGKYFTMPVPQYETFESGQFINIKADPDFPVLGDNAHNDGPSINGILQKYAGCKIIFFPAGIYLTDETIYVPPGSRIVGESLGTVISGTGANFRNPDTPLPVVMVGKPGESGVAQLTDILLSTADVLPGAIIVQVNMAGKNPGDVGLWNCVIRVGGSTDSLVTRNCGGPDPGGCKAAFALLHVGKTASAYFEDIWGWVADHPLDPGLPVQNIAVGRGALIQSTGPTWFVGTAFEHCVLYQYNLHKAANVYIGLQQTESPYWQGQGTPQKAPMPWTPNSAFGDPTFANCQAQSAASNDQCYRAWAHHSFNTSSTIIHGSAMWVFFNRLTSPTPADPMCDTTGGVCQLNMAYVTGANATYWYSIGTKSAVNIVYDEAVTASGGGGGAGGGGVRLAPQRETPGGWGGVVAAYLRGTAVLPGPLGGSATDGGGRTDGGGGGGSGSGGNKPKHDGARGGKRWVREALWLALGLAGTVVVGLL